MKEEQKSFAVGWGVMKAPMCSIEQKQHCLYSSIPLVIWKMKIIHKNGHRQQFAEWFFKKQTPLNKPQLIGWNNSAIPSFTSTIKANNQVFMSFLRVFSLYCFLIVYSFFSSVQCPLLTAPPPSPAIWYGCQHCPPEIKLACSSDSGECVSAD